jgi:hypothetical protein
MHKDATATRFEDMQLAHAFEERYGREMTAEEKKFISLSDIVFKNEYLLESLGHSLDHGDSDDGRHAKHRSSSPVALMSNGSELLGKKVA